MTSIHHVVHPPDQTFPTFSRSRGSQPESGAEDWYVSPIACNKYYVMSLQKLSKATIAKQRWQLNFVFIVAVKNNSITLCPKLSKLSIFRRRLPRDAMLAWYMLSLYVRMYVCTFVRLSVCHEHARYQNGWT